MPASEPVRGDHPVTWLSPLSVTPKERTALLHEIEGSCRSSQNSTPTLIADTPVSSADIRLSDAIAYAYATIDEYDSSHSLTSAHQTATSSGTASAGEDQGQSLAPTYFGYLEVKEDALRLLEGSLQGILRHSSRGPQGVASAIRSGYIFIWEEEISAIQYWDDGISWTPMDHDNDFWISRETRLGDGLWRKQISIPALGRFHHFVSYYNPWDTVNGTLKAPSEDSDLRSMNLRDDLALQLTTSYPSTEHCQLLKDSSCVGLLQFMRSALLLCLCFADEDLYEILLQRKAGDWFPHIRSGSVYWHELSSRDPFRGMKPRDLKTQIKMLLLSLVEFSNCRTPSRLLRHQPSKEFSAVQNRSLFGEIFRIPHHRLLSPRSFDPAKLSTDLARSVLFDQTPKMDLMSVENWRNDLMLLMPFDPPAYGVSAAILRILEQVAIEECEKFRMISMVHCNQFPRFIQANNRLPLFLVVCQSIPVSRKIAELLHNWSISTDGIKTYRCLLKITQNALPSDELMLSLSALAALHSIMRGTESDSSETLEPIQLVDVHRLLTGEKTTPINQAILRDMVWSFYRAVTQALSPNAYPPYFRFLDPTLAVSTSEQNHDKILDHYWMKRLHNSLSHADAMALSITADGKTRDETSDYNTTQVGNRPLVKQIEDGCGLDNAGNHTSLPWWLTFLRVLGTGVCIRRSG